MNSIQIYTNLAKKLFIKKIIITADPIQVFLNLFALLGLKVKEQTFKHTWSLDRRALRNWRSPSAYPLWDLIQRATSLSIQIQFHLSWILIIKLKPIFFTSPDALFLPTGKFQTLSQLFRWHFHGLLCCKAVNFWCSWSLTWILSKS